MADQPAKANPEHDDSDRGFFDLPDFGALGSSFVGWCRANPGGCALLAGILGILGYYFFGLKLFLSHSQTPATWIVRGWTEENDQQHCYAILPITILLVLMRWRDLQAAPREPSNRGLWWLGAGILAMIAAVRCVEGRFTIIALALLCYGITQYLFGRAVSRILAFPCVFLLFMLPLGNVVQGTASLQSNTASVVRGLCNLVGVGLRTEGDNLISTQNAFEPLEVAGGCSGIRSLMAMMMLAALYAYFVIRSPGRGFILFCCSLIFALIGNIVRVFTVVLVARFFGNGPAHIYHDWSGFVFFPVAVLAMVGVGNLLNREWNFAALLQPRPQPLPAPAPSPAPATSQESGVGAAGAEGPAADDAKPQLPRPSYDY